MASLPEFSLTPSPAGILANLETNAEVAESKLNKFSQDLVYKYYPKLTVDDIGSFDLDRIEKVVEDKDFATFKKLYVEKINADIQLGRAKANTGNKPKKSYSANLTPTPSGTQSAIFKKTLGGRGRKTLRKKRKSRR